jgi:hypothetical protein
MEAAVCSEIPVFFLHDVISQQTLHLSHSIGEMYKMNKEILTGGCIVPGRWLFMDARGFYANKVL